MMRALVTGWAGFIGGHPVEHLLGQRHVVALDELSTGLVDNLRDVADRGDLQFHCRSVLDAELREDHDRVVGSPRWSHSEAKALDESLVASSVEAFGMHGVIARLLNTVGPRLAVRFGVVVPRLVAQALAREPLTVFGTGGQIRCACHVLDVVPAPVDIAACDEATGRAVHIGRSEPVSIGELARRVIEGTGSQSTSVRRSYEEVYRRGHEDLRRRVPDCGLADQLLGFRAARDLDEIIDVVVADQLTRRSALA